VTRAIKALLIEDNPLDAELVIRELRHAGFELEAQRIETPGELRAALQETSWDLILSDHSMPDFGSAEALSIVRELGRDVPFVIVSGEIGERAAIDVMRAGARDYIAKGNLSRLGVVVRRELEDAERRHLARRRDEERRTLYEIASIGKGLVDRATFCNLAVSELSRFMGVERSLIYWWDDRAGVLRLATDGAGPSAQTKRELEPGEGIAGSAFQRGVPVVVSERDLDPRAISATQVQPRSVAAFPLLGSMTTLGVLVVTLRDGAFKPEDLESIALIAAAIAPPLEIRSLFDEAEQRRGEMQDRETHLRTLVDTSPIAVIQVDHAGLVRLWNPAAEKLLGYAPEEVLGEPLRLMPERRREDFAVLIQRLEAHGTVLNVDTVAQRKGGQDIDVSVSAASMKGPDGHTGITIFIEDVTQRREFLRELEFRALHDALTQLPNRTLLNDRLTQEIRNCERNGTGLALLLADLDDFKAVNDTFGHDAGDELLRQIGKRFEQQVREADTVARLGGDEFALVLPGATQAGAVRVAKILIDALREPFEIDAHGQRVDTAASFGIVMYPSHGRDAGTLLRLADIAMYAAKRQQESYAVYAAVQETTNVERLVFATDLRTAIEQHAERREIRSHLQPIASLADDSIVGFEGLARWVRPVLGDVPPGEFIAVAERSALMRPLTRITMDEAVSSFAQIGPAGFGRGLSINLSARSLLDPDLPRQLAALVERYPATSGPLTIEITESALMVDPDRTVGILADLRSLGVRFAIDDFGVGYSSLAYLNRLPIDEVKIDRSFVGTMDQDARSAVIVRATIDLAHNLGCIAVAEGVEREGTRLVLRELGCDRYQGFLLSKALRPEDLELWLAARTREVIAVAV
jgi:diguanylate cyclase (GGDEF)-like protein/PAS domain S-box-containing protein